MDGRRAHDADRLDALLRRRGHHRRPQAALRRAPPARARPLAVLPRPVARRSRERAAACRFAGRHQVGADVRVRYVEHRSRDPVARRRAVHRRARAHRRALSRPLSGVDQHRHDGHARRVRAGRRGAGGVRRAGDRAAAGVPIRGLRLDGGSRARRTRRAGHRRRRSFREHRLVAARRARQAVARHAELRGDVPAARIWSPR